MYNSEESGYDLFAMGCNAGAGAGVNQSVVTGLCTMENHFSIKIPKAYVAV